MHHRFTTDSPPNHRLKIKTMFIKVDYPSAFLKPYSLIQFCRRHGVRSFPMNEWIEIYEKMEVQHKRKFRSLDLILIGLGLNERKGVLVKRLERKRVVVGIELMDCVIVNPLVLGKELMKL